ncbi:MAG: FAD:protein FMN transferase [Bdellovibrionales bacterium]|nr:FAD:protein FMN transferase [Bdellovibrionales bacterium]
MAAPLQEKHLHEFSFSVFGGLSKIVLYHDHQLDAAEIEESLKDDILGFQAKYSRYDSNSVVSQINASSGNQSVKLDDEASSLLDYAFTAYQQSNGLFDVTSGVLRKVWDFSADRVPSSNELREILPLIGLSKVKWEKPIVQLPLAGMEIDFGGFGKEYAVDRAASFLLEKGITNGMLNFSGDIRVLGPKPDGTPWKIGVTHPRKEQDVVGHITVHQGAVATSGDYERYIEVEGKRYCHILNPKTGWPVSDLQSVTVVSQACLLAGTFSTIAMLYGEKKGKRLLADASLQHVMVNHQGKVRAFPSRGFCT